MIYTTEDGEQVATGELVFNYYDRKLGTIGDDAGDGWFDHVDDEGRRTMLNGERICTVAFAVARGWIPLPRVPLRDKLRTERDERQVEHDLRTRQARRDLGLSS